MKDKELRKEMQELKKELRDAKVIKSHWGEGLYSTFITVEDLVKKLRAEGVLKPVSIMYPAPPTYKDLVKEVKELRCKLNAALELLNIEEVKASGSSLRKVPWWDRSPIWWVRDR